MKRLTFIMLAFMVISGCSNSLPKMPEMPKLPKFSMADFFDCVTAFEEQWGGC